MSDASFAGPLRLIGGGLLVVAALIAAVGTAYAFGAGTYDFAYLIGVAVFAALGGGLRFAAGRLASGGGIDLPTVGAGIFATFGLVIAGVGVSLVFDDPAGFFVIGFGLVFVGAGFLAWKLFRTPSGKRMVAVQGHAVRGRRQTTLIHVDAAATPEQVEQARADWVASQLASRPDWAAGRIAADESRGRNVMLYAAAVWAALASGLVIAGLVWADEFFFLISGFVWLAVAGLAIGGVVRRMRLAKFGDSHLVLEAMPARVGELLAGEVQTGIAANAPPREGFRLTLKCIHRYERTRGSGSDRRTERHRDTLWQAEATSPGHRTARLRGLAVPVRFALPADQPASTLGGTNGILWELTVAAAVPGLDYAATFELPVLPSDAAIAVR